MKSAMYACFALMAEPGQVSERELNVSDAACNKDNRKHEHHDRSSWRSCASHRPALWSNESIISSGQASRASHHPVEQLHSGWSSEASSGMGQPFWCGLFYLTSYIAVSKGGTVKRHTVPLVQDDDKLGAYHFVLLLYGACTQSHRYIRKVGARI